MRTLKTAIEYWDYFYKMPIKKLYGVKIRVTYNKYIQFLKQPLQLWMFILCDKEWEPLEKPEKYHFYKKGITNGETVEWLTECKEYQQACDRKIFTGFELYQDTYFNNYNCVIRSSDMVIINIENKTIEDIAKFKVEVTERISKQFKY